MKRDTCEMMRQCWYKDLRKPILDLPPGNMTHICDSRIARITAPILWSKAFGF